MSPVGQPSLYVNTGYAMCRLICNGQIMLCSLFSYRHPEKQSSSSAWNCRHKDFQVLVSDQLMESKALMFSRTCLSCDGEILDLNFALRSRQSNDLI